MVSRPYENGRLIHNRKNQRRFFVPFLDFVAPPPGECMASLPIESSINVSSGFTRKKNYDH
jgi:hypothetical protein